MLDAKYDECGQTLGMSKVKRFLIKLPMLRGSILVAVIFTIAMSLGEFGASWVVTEEFRLDNSPGDDRFCERLPLQ